MPKTKIIATIGPSSDTVVEIKKMIKAGMNVARLNLSHNTQPYHAQCIENVRKAADELKVSVAIILDLQGPKMRVGKIAEQGVDVSTGDKIVLIPEDSSVPIKKALLYIPIQILDFYKYVKKNQLIYIDDAMIELRVTKVDGKAIECLVKNDGVINSHKGINAPGIDTHLPALSGKDLYDLDFGIKHRVDFIALSYIGS